MDSLRKSVWQIRAAALAIFLLGFVAGALTLNYYRLRHPVGPPAFARGRFEQMLERLDLTQGQRTQVEKILSDSRAQLSEMRRKSEPDVMEIRRQTEERLQAVLSPQQWEQFQQMMNEWRNRRRNRERGQ
jgi:Spy/CpxP family protein refolding chaperone